MNTWISWKTDKTIFLVLLGLIFFSHLPFIQSDPDRNMSVGRGPYTDEGLNTVQVRNWVNSGHLSLTECDNLLKTPLFGFPLALTYRLFGSSLAVSRLHVLILVFFALLWIGMHSKSKWILILLPVTMLQYPIFHSSHFSMAEMTSVAATLLAIHFFTRAFDPVLLLKTRDRNAVLSGFFLSMTFYMKIQFIYLVFLIPAALLILWFTTNYFIRNILVRQGFLMTLTLLVFLLLYFFAWYLPNRPDYDFMMEHQSGEFVISGKTWEYIRFNLEYHFLRGWPLWFTLIFLLFLISGLGILRRNRSGNYPILFIPSLVWFLLELHKLTLPYLPTRYQVSLFASAGMIISVVSREILSRKATRWKMLFKTTVALAIVILTSLNLYNYFDSLKHREYAIREANKYMSRNLQEGAVALGAWAPGLTWNSKARALPVWNHFLNYKDPINKFHPQVIIAETDEKDSEQAWSEQGIDLNEQADSAKTVRIGHWNVRIYWLKQEY